MPLRARSKPGEDDSPLILLTNDDGIDAPGLLALERALESLDPRVVAPMEHCSGSSLAIGLYSDLEVERRGAARWAVRGTPVDCVKLALLELLEKRPGLVISGINPGPNAANNIHYSGTVGAATEAAMWNVPAMAVSSGSGIPLHLASAASFVLEFVLGGSWRDIPPGCLLNLNIPDLPACELGHPVWTRTGRFLEDIPFTVIEPGKLYRYSRWTAPCERPEPGTDLEALASGRISMTLLTVERSAGAGSREQPDRP
ncbi:5'/3'-nucleotidase SurE [Candidatus Fermentibacteria bacterium]|nr:5'/3'-nucleotidase SurE [Candidatus Fermentibacteria bacterium]